MSISTKHLSDANAILNVMVFPSTFVPADRSSREKEINFNTKNEKERAVVHLAQEEWLKTSF